MTARHREVLSVRSVLHYEMHQLRPQPYQDLVAAAKTVNGVVGVDNVSPAAIERPAPGFSFRVTPGLVTFT